MFSFIWHTFFYDPVYNTLVFFIDHIPNGDVGLAIVATVVLVKMILLPVSIKAAKTQRIMREIEPKLKAIKEEHADDREAQARAMMEIYKDAGMNPFASIFLIFLQIPIFIALYFSVLSLLVTNEETGVTTTTFDASLLYSFVPVPEVASTMMLGVIDVVAHSWPLALLAAITMFFQMKLTLPALPPKKDGDAPDMKEDFMRNMQVQMKYVMPVLIGVIAYTFSATIALYFVVSNLTAIAQEFWVRKHR